MRKIIQKLRESNVLPLFSRMKSLTIRKGKIEDLPTVLALIIELAIYEKAPHEVTNTLAKLEADGFGPNPVYGLIVAEEVGKIVGIAIHYLRYSTWKGRMLYLEDIVVTESHRGKGIGHALFEACMHYTAEMKYAGMVWQVLDWNEPAIRFYEKYHARLDPEWMNGTLTRQQIDHFLTKN